jgi:hypothetical protein
MHAKALSPGRMPYAELPIRAERAFLRVDVVPPVVPAPAWDDKEIMFTECLP